MPPDSRADGPCGPKARRTRGTASPGQRTAQPFGGTLNASPLRCTPGASAPTGVRQALRRPRHTRGIGPTRGFRGPCRPLHAGDIGPRRRSATHAGRRTRGASAPPRGHSAGLPQAAAMRGTSALAGVPQASRRPPPCAGHRPLAGVPRAAVHEGPRPSRAFRGPRRPPHTRGIGPRGGSAGLPPPAATRGASALAGVPQASRRPPPCAGHRSSRPTPPSQAFPTPPAARARPHLPAARFSRKPPCGIGSRMVYCT